MKVGEGVKERERGRDGGRENLAESDEAGWGGQPLASEGAKCGMGVLGLTCVLFRPSSRTEFAKLYLYDCSTCFQNWNAHGMRRRVQRERDCLLRLAF